eukprot:3227608-Pyramimonas_sp.AAC.1
MRVRIDSQECVDLITIKGGLRFSKRKDQAGRVLNHDVPELRLIAGDRLDPSPDLLDIAAFEELDLSTPKVVHFWRKAEDPHHRNLTSVLRRNPLFCPQVGVTPERSLHIDILHTLYLGVFQRYVCAVIWAAMNCNVYQFSGPVETVRELTLYRIFLDMKQ